MVREPDRLSGDTFDILVIGGGIVGTAIARDAALRGLKVALVEKADFASGTSGKSSKLAHGGLRYLEHGNLGLVRESCRERERLFRLAPHLVRPLPFLLPYRPGSGWLPLWMVGIGLKIYDTFAGRTQMARHRMLSREELAKLEPAAVTPDTQGGAFYYDGQMDDARLTLECAIGAAEGGALIVNYAEVTGLPTQGKRIAGAQVRDLVSGREYEVRSKLVVNAAGPWGDRILDLAGWKGKPRLRPTQGVHLVYGQPLVKHALIERVRSDRRVFFIIPWEGMTLIGTTDTDFSADPSEARVTEEDVAYLLEAASEVLEGVKLERENIVSSFAAVRPLLGSGGSSHSPSKVSREHAIFEEPTGLLSVLGGKFTTFRAIAQEAVDLIQMKLRLPVTSSGTADALFPGGGLSSLAACPPALDRYGSLAPRVLEHVPAIPDGIEPLCPHSPRLRAEVAHAVREEMALTLEDVLVRRLGLAHGVSCRGLDAAQPAAEIMASLLGWDASRTQSESESYRKRYLVPF